MPKEEKLEGGRKASGVIIPPDGGWGWMIVASCFVITICTRALTRCVSIFFVEFQLCFEKDYSTTAWIQSLMDCTTMLCAPLGGFLENHFSCRVSVFLGGLLSSVGLVLGSIASRLEHLYICLGILSGLGFALSFTPALGMVGTYFVEKRALAYGIAVSGTGIGTFILAPAVQMLIQHYSWRGTLLILGGFVSNLCVCGALMRPLKPRGGERTWENTMENLEEDCMTSMLDEKDIEKEAADCSQVEEKQLERNHFEDHGLLIANRGHKIFALDNSNLVQENMGLMGSSCGLPDPSLTDQKIAECLLLSNKLTETMLMDPNPPNGSTIEELKPTESTNLNKTADMDEKIEDSGLNEAQSTDAYLLNKTVSTPPESLVNTRTASRSNICLKSREKFGFLLSHEFLILALSVLFLAYAFIAPAIYLVPYALSMGIEHHQATLLLSMYGISSIVGNITIGWIADKKCVKKYRMQTYMALIGMEGLCCLFFLLLQSFSLFVPFSVLYGYLEGAYGALIPVVASDVVSPKDLASAVGVVYFLHSIPFLISPPIGGWLIDRTGNYAATFLLSAATFMFSSAVLGTAMLVRRCCRSRSNLVVHLSPSHTCAAAAQQGTM